MPNFIQTENAAQSAEQLAQAVGQNLYNTLKKQERATLAVSGGKSPIVFFQVLSQTDLDWKRVNITLVDERIVPTTHADSNTHLIRQYLLKNQASDAQFLPLIDDRADECSLKDMNHVIDFALQHYVQPDVLILGMGNDGHTASIFPQAPQFIEAIRSDYPQPLLHTTPITAPHERISMTLSAIEATPHVYLSIAGTEKWDVYRQAEQAITQQFPISYILNSQKVNANVFYHN